MNYPCNLYINYFKKFAISKKVIGIETQKLCKQVSDQKTIETKWSSTEEKL